MEGKGMSCDLELGLRLGVGHSHREVEEDHPNRAATTGSGRSPQHEHLTILYKGDVCVYKNVTEAQAKAILLLAGCGERPRRLSWFDAAKELTLKPVLPVIPPSRVREEGRTTERCGDAAASSALMMKRSLQRFLEKRKMRMQESSACPY